MTKQENEHEDEELCRKLNYYWDNYVQAFVHPLTSNRLLNRFITNSAVTGTYAEAWIHFFAKSMLPQFRISTGAIISAADQDKNLRSIPQIDLIIWDPSMLPALFEQGNFALVPIHSARAIIEVKRSCSSSSSITKFENQLRKRQDYLFSAYHQNGFCFDYRPNVLGIVIKYKSPLFKGENNGRVSPKWLEDKQWRETPAMTRLFDTSNAHDRNGILTFIYFLSQIANQPRRAFKDALQKLQQQIDDQMKLERAYTNSRIEELASCIDAVE